MRHLEEFHGVAAGAGVGRRGEHVLGGLVVQRVVEQRHRARRVAERRMLGDVLDPLAIDVDLAAVAQRFQELRAGHRALPCRWPFPQYTDNCGQYSGAALWASTRRLTATTAALSRGCQGAAMAKDDSRFLDKPGHLIRRLQQIALALFLNETKAFGITPVQYSAMIA